jgi:hypothetical protein
VCTLGAVIVAQFVAPSAGALELPAIVCGVLLLGLLLHTICARRRAPLAVGLHDVPLAEDLFPLDRVEL